MDPLIPSVEDYLGRADYTLRVAPIRRALVVQDGDAAQLRLALQWAMTVWGGGRSPVVRIGEDGSAFDSDLQIAWVLRANHALDFRSDGPPVPNLGMPLWTADVYKSIYGWPPHAVVPEPDGSVLEITTTRAASLVAAAGAGTYDGPSVIGPFRDAGYNVLENGGELQLALAQIAERTAWAATLVGDVDSEIRNGWASTVGFLIVAQDEEDYQSSVWFWNYRALRPRGPARHASVSVLASRETVLEPRFLEDFKAAVLRTSRSTPSFIVHCDDDLRDDLLERLEATYDQSGEYYERWAMGEYEPPLTLGHWIDPRQIWLSERYSGPPTVTSVTMRRPESQVSWVSPVKWRSGFMYAGNVHALIRSTAIDGPRHDAVAELFHPDASWAGDDLAIEVMNVPEYNLEIGLPTPQEVLVATLAGAGLSFALSDKGRQISGLTRAHSRPNLFRDLATFEVITALTAKPGRDMAREIKKLRESGELSDAKIDELKATFVAGSRPVKTASEIRSFCSEEVRPRIPAVLEELLASGGVELGVIVTCALCLLAEFRPVQAAQGPPTCGGCGSPARIKATEAGDPLMHFRLTGLLHTASQNGGMVPFAAQVLLEQEGAYVVPGANLSRQGRAAGEVDLLGWVGRRSFAGEVKSSAGGFHAMNGSAEIEKLAATGVDQVILVCGEPVDAESVVALESHAAAIGADLRLIDGTLLWA